MNTADPVVYVVDDEASIRKLFELFLKSRGFIVKTFSNASDFLALESLKHPSCLILDLCMPVINGLQLQEKLQKKNIDIPIIFITGQGDIPNAVKAMKSGAVDFLTKPLIKRTILSAIFKAIEKDSVEIQMRQRISEIRQRLATLTPRESEVLQFVVKGFLNKQIAGKLGISIKTVKVHRRQVMLKMKAESLAELVNLTQTSGI